MNSTEFKNSLYNSKTDKLNLFGLLKQQSNIRTFNSFLKDHLNHPITSKILFANPLPSNYNELRKSKVVPFSNNLEGEIAWNLLAISKFANEINIFLELKEEYEKLFLLNNLQESKIVLEKIENEICKSLWSLENRFVLNEWESGVAKNWSTLSEFSKLLTEPLVLYFAEYFSKKAESRISYYRYKNLFNNQIKDLKGPEAFIEYLCFRLDYLGYTGFNAYSYYLNVESTSSIIDRYLLMIDVLSELACSEDKNEVNLVSTVVSQLIKVIKDKRLYQLNNFINPNEPIIFETSKNYIDIIDNYLEGNFDYCIVNSLELIINQPSVLEFYEIYVRSLIETQKNLEDQKLPPIIDSIVSNLYNVFKKGKDYNHSTEELLKLSSSFFPTNWAKQLFGICSQLSNIENDTLTHLLLFYINSSFNNPTIIKNKALIEKGNSKLIVEFYLKNFPSITTKLSHALLKGDSKVIENLNLSVNQKDLYFNIGLINASKIPEAIIGLQEFITNENLSNATFEEAVFLLYSCYLKVGQYNEAVKLYIESYLENEGFVARIRIQNLHEELKKNKNSGLEGYIELPIFYKLAGAGSYDQFVAYDNFLESLNIEIPTKILNFIDNFNKTKILFFLREVCTIDVLQNSLAFNTYDEVENERISILQELLKLDKVNEEIYIKEITEITQASTIRDAIREVNKGRITVNVQQLKANESNNIKESFLRYKELAAFSKDKDWMSVDVSSKLISQYLTSINDDSIKSKIVNLNDPAFITFKVMFIEIRDKYILSKEFGLDGYLSTRIRHGTLVNHIRSVFETLNLVSQKNNKGEYNDNDYWNDKMPYYLTNKSNQIQAAIKKFSRRVDDLTEHIIKDLIQVKTEKYQEKKDALFDYSLDPVFLGYVFKKTRDEIKDPNSFIDFIFNYLEARTQAILENIRIILNSKIKDRYENLIEELHLETKKILEYNSFPELSFSITKCNTNINNELRNISEWFHLSNPTKELVLDLESVIKTGIEISNTIYPNNKISPIVEVEKNLSVKGTIHLIYIVRILLDNIITHSGLSGENLKIHIKVEMHGDHNLRLIFENNFSDNLNQPKLFEQLSLVKDKWLKQEVEFENINTEGGSGFDKIRRILVYDMESNDQHFDFKLEDQKLSIIIDLDIKS